MSYEADAKFMKRADLTPLIGVLTTEENISPILDKVPVPACTWAVFPNEGPFPCHPANTMARYMQNGCLFPIMK